MIGKKEAARAPHALCGQLYKGVEEHVEQFEEEEDEGRSEDDGEDEDTLEEGEDDEEIQESDLKR